MAQRSFPFDAGSGAIVTEADWSAMASQFADNGLIDSNPTSENTSIFLVAGAGGNQISVGAGSYVIDGFFYVNDATVNLAFTANSDPTNARRDRVILRLDRTENSIQLAIKEGTPAAAPVVPSLTDNATTTEVAIAWYSVGAGSSTNGPVTFEALPASRRVPIVSANSQIPWGGIAFNRIDNKFYMRNASGVVSEIGPAGTGDFRIATNITKPTGPGTLDGLTVYETDTRTLSAYMASLGGYVPIAGLPITRTKPADSGLLSGAGTVVDGALYYHLPVVGPYRICGEVFYSSNTAAATAVFSLQGPTSSYVRGVFRHITGSGTNVVHTTSDAFSSGCTIGTPVVGTIYAVSFDFVIFATDVATDIAIRTNAHSGSSQWTIRSRSFLRVEKTMTG